MVPSELDDSAPNVPQGADAALNPVCELLPVTVLVTVMVVGALVGVVAVPCGAPPLVALLSVLPPSVTGDGATLVTGTVDGAVDGTVDGATGPVTPSVPAALVGGGDVVSGTDPTESVVDRPASDVATPAGGVSARCTIPA
ncbi:MAG: hypothetical protein BGO26_06995 [Actinobacteria bacterium 69-20]|nr:MAG: hypothetical protein BGO26_06995 [Actinobacteria bacterium 69-20]